MATPQPQVSNKSEQFGQPPCPCSRSNQRRHASSGEQKKLNIGGFPSPPNNGSSQMKALKSEGYEKKQNRGGFPSPRKLDTSETSPPTHEKSEGYGKKQNRGGFPSPQKLDTSETSPPTHEKRNTEQRPRAGFGLPPSSVMCLEEASKNVVIKEANGNAARRMLAHLSRKVASYSYSTPEGSTCLFAYVPGKSDPIGVIVFTIADDSTDRNTIEFQFIHQRYQRLGIGKRLLLKAMHVVAARNKKQVYLEAAEQSVEFYKKLGFTDCGDVIETAGPGAAMFHCIYPMTRQTPDLACH